MDQAQIYKKQEKEFNIISFYPKEVKPSLRQFPKLTMEDRIIEKKNKDPIFQGWIWLLIILKKNHIHSLTL